jgi:hypothetical protein
MDYARIAPVRKLVGAWLLAALLIGHIPAAAPVAAQPPAPPGFAATAQTPLATPELHLPDAPVAPRGPALNATAGMAGPAPGTPLTAPLDPFPARAPAPRMQQAGATCAPLLTNPTLDFGYGWTVLEAVVNLGTAAYYSAPNSLWVWDTSPTNEVDPSPNQDVFGQDFFFPPDTASVLIEFQILYEFPDPNDRVFYEFYGVDANGNLIDEDPLTPGITSFAVGEVPDLTPNTWHYFADFLGDQPGEDQIVARARTYGRIALVLRTLTNTLAPYEAVSFDNIQVTACSSATLPQGQVSGQVSGAGDLSDALLALFSFSGVDDAALVDVTTPDAAGNYAFRSLYPPPANSYYQVVFINNGKDGRLSYWAGPPITSFAGNQAAGGNFSIADARLSTPPNYGRVTFPATFTWQTRSQSGEQYYLCIYEADTFSEVCSEEPLSGGSFTIANAGALEGIPGFRFAYGKVYGWYVRVAGPGFDNTRFAHLGASGYSQFVSFTPTAQTPAPAPPPVSTPPPPPASEQARWTILFYLAGDDEQLTHGAPGARTLVDMLTNLSTLGDRFPNVNIVAQFDFYETQQRPLPPDLRGTQRCHFRPGVTRLADACQQLGELNTGDPATLTDFLNAALSRYPAERTMLVIVGHGSTVSGVAGDQTQPAGQPDDALRPDELEQALQAAGIGTSRKKLDAIVFYACLMGSFEIAAIMSPFAEYMVASPNIATLVDINEAILGRAAQSADARVVASGIVQEYEAALTRFNQTTAAPLSIAMAAYDLRQFAAVRAQIDTLGLALRDNLSRQEVAAARDAVQLYDSSAPVLWGNATGRGEDALIDLRDLANRLAQAGLPPEVTGAAQALCTSGPGCQDGLANLIVRSVARNGRADQSVAAQHVFANSRGLAIYFPNNSEEGNQPSLTRSYLLYYRQTSFRTSPWVQFVDATRTSLPTLPRRARLGSNSSPGGTLQNLVAPEIFPVAASLPASGGRLYLPVLRR